MVSLMEHKVVMVFCAHTTLFPEIFTCLLIFAQRSSKVFWYLPKADLCASADRYLPTDLCTSADICPRNFAKLLLFYHIFPHVCCNLPTDLCLSADIGPQIFAHLLIFAHSRSLHFCRYLPLDLRASTDIGPQIFAPVLIFAHRSLHVFWYLPRIDLRTSSPKVTKKSSNVTKSYQFSVKNCGWYCLSADRID